MPLIVDRLSIKFVHYLSTFGGDALGRRLRRNKTWIKFKKQAEKLQEELVPYAFRHRYAKVAHARSVELGLTIKDISFVMGHTSEVHQQNLFLME